VANDGWAELGYARHSLIVQPPRVGGKSSMDPLDTTGKADASCHAVRNDRRPSTITLSNQILTTGARITTVWLSKSQSRHILVSQ
jgi:hypothetical protein